MAENACEKKFFDGCMALVNQNIDFYSATPLGDDSEVGSVLKEATSTRGKMLRPQLVLLSAAYGAEFESRKERLCKLAAMVELTHMASLIHDDIVDDAPARRGKPSLQSRYGKNAAVYAGDYLMSRIAYMMASEDMTQAGMTIAKAIEEMCLGEMGQSCCKYRGDVSISDYLFNIHGKTAALFMAACKVGAEEARCGAETVAQIVDFAECLGIMFQLRDDLLDFTSDVETMGKETCKDFREGVYTMPVLQALQNPAGKAAMTKILNSNAEGTLSEKQMSQLLVLVNDLGGIESTKEEIRRLQKKAEDIVLNDLPHASSSEMLLSMLNKLVKDL